MLLKRKFVIFGLLVALGLFNACNQTANKVNIDPGAERIPLSVTDSSILSLDKSPMDMSYYPAEYPKQKMMTPEMANPVARIIYSRPKKNGRIIFADSADAVQNIIQRYGQEWRLGANEASEIEFFKPVRINGKKIATGRYIIYCIPNLNKWNIILNTNLFSWGLHIDKTKDIAEIELPLIKNDVEIEYFTMQFQQSNDGFELVMAWGNMKAVLPIGIIE